MQITSIEVSGKLTLPTQPYANVLPEVRVTASLQPGDDVEQCTQNLRNHVVSSLRGYAAQLVALGKELR